MPRTADATHTSYLEYMETKPTAWKYYPSRVAVALIGEVFFRATGLADTFSWKKLEGVTSWLPGWFPGVNAEGVVEGATKLGSDAAKNAVFETANAGADAVKDAAVKASWVCDYLSCDKLNVATGLVNRGWDEVFKLASSHKEMILVVGGFAVAAAAINQLASGKIKSDTLRGGILRGGLSLSIGGAAVWTVSNYLVNHQVGINTLADIGLRMVVSHLAIKHFAAPLLQKTLSITHNAMNGLRWDYNYTAPKIPKSKS